MLIQKFTWAELFWSKQDPVAYVRAVEAAILFRAITGGSTSWSWLLLLMLHVQLQTAPMLLQGHVFGSSLLWAWRVSDWPLYSG